MMIPFIARPSGLSVLPVLFFTVLLFCSGCRTVAQHWALGKEAEQHEHYEDAIRYYTEVLDVTPSNKDVLYQRAKNYYACRKYDLAFADLSKILALDSTFFDAHYTQAQIYVARKQYDLALTSYNKFLHAQPGNVAGYYDRGWTYYAKKMYDSALADWNTVLTLHSPDPSAHTSRGEAYSALHNYPVALAEYSEAIASFQDMIRNRENNSHINYWALRMLSPSDRNMARKYVMRTIGIYYPILSRCYANRAYLYAKLDDHEAAIRDYTQALEWDSTSTIAWTNLGWEYYLQNDFHRCIACSEYAIHYNGYDLYARFNRALACLRLGEVEQAQEAYRETLEFIAVWKESAETDRESTIKAQRRAIEAAIYDLRELLKQNIQTSDVYSILDDIFKDTVKWQ